MLKKNYLKHRELKYFFKLKKLTLKNLYKLDMRNIVIST